MPGVVSHVTAADVPVGNHSIMDGEVFATSEVIDNFRNAYFYPYFV